MESKIIGLILLVCAGLLFQYSYKDFSESFFSPENKLKERIEKDIKRSLPPKLSQRQNADVREVQVIYRSKEAHEYLKNHQPNFKTTENGSIGLEVEILDLPDLENPGFIIQTSVFDLKTKNKIGEFGETYYAKDFDKNLKIQLQEPSPKAPPDLMPPKSLKKESLKTK